jgi:hypothetical protein
MFAHFLLRPLSVLGSLSLAGMAAWRLCGYFGSGWGWKPRESTLENTIYRYVRNARDLTHVHTIRVT